jgi:predicted sulfurtransferase
VKDTKKQLAAWRRAAMHAIGGIRCEHTHRLPENGGEYPQLYIDKTRYLMQKQVRCYCDGCTAWRKATRAIASLSPSPASPREG